MSKLPHIMNLRSLALITWLASGTVLLAVGVTEPATTFYGKILGTGDERPYLVTDGTLEWRIQRADGSVLILNAIIDAVPSNGAFSYRLDVPHEALSQGLGTSGKVIALGSLPESFSHVSILVDGMAATVIGPSGSSFDARQAARAATHRLDLEVGLLALDGDGDGMPDWWEDLHGLDSQDPADANGDRDGDGLSKLAEFRRGTSPNHDNREPELLTGEVLAYAGVTTGVILEIEDIDSIPAQLAITLDTAPVVGSLHLRDGGGSAAAPDRQLAVGDVFTYQDVRRGRLIYVHGSEEEGAFASFGISIADENPAHTAAQGLVRIAFYHPDAQTLALLPAAQRLAIAGRSGDLPGVSGLMEERLRRYILAREGNYVVWESAATSRGIALSSPTSSITPEDYLFNHILGRGPARPQTFRGSAGDDVLIGGMERDIFEGGGGNDTFTGKGGADDFVLNPSRGGASTITDFNSQLGDRIIIAGVKGVGSVYLADHVRMRNLDGVLVLETSPAGTGLNFTGASLRLVGVPVTTSLREFAETGSITGDGLLVKPYLTVVASKPHAYEDGEAGEFLIKRGGDVSTPLTVRLSVSGSASPGVDYQTLPATLDFPEGAVELKVPVLPFMDSVMESNGEVVFLNLLADASYDLGSQISAQVTIYDPVPVLALEVEQAVASVAGPVPGSFLLSRTSALDRSVLVRFTITGSATNGIDYDALLTTVTLGPGETHRLIPIQPKAGATLSSGAEVVRLTLRVDGNYRIGHSAAAEVTLVPQLEDLDSWAARHFPGLADPAAADPGGFGTPLLMRYALRLDPASPAHGTSVRYSVVNGFPSIEFDVQPGDPNISYVPEVGIGGGEWHSGPAHLVQVLPANGYGNPWKKSFRSRVPIKDAPTQLLRVRVQNP